MRSRWLAALAAALVLAAVPATALAITNGFRNTVQRSFLAATAHVIIKEKTAGPGISGWQGIAQKLATLPGVKDVTPGLYDSGYVSGPINSAGLVIKGISLAPGAYLPDTLTHLSQGSVSDLRSEEKPGIILGARFAEQVGARVGTEVNLMIPNGDITPFGPRPSYERVRVAGIFESGMYDFDNGWAFMKLEDVQRLLGGWANPASPSAYLAYQPLDGHFRPSSTASPLRLYACLSGLYTAGAL